MKTAITTASLLAIVAIAVSSRAADPTTPQFWSAAQRRALDEKLASSIDPATGVSLERIMDSVLIVHRSRQSDPEIHRVLGDFVTFNSGSGHVTVGGTIVNPRELSADEVVGTAIEGGERFPFSAGDTMYLPPNLVHQFVPAPGSSFSMTIVKVTPRK